MATGPVSVPVLIPPDDPRRSGREDPKLRRYYHFGPTRTGMYVHRYHAINLGRTSIWRTLGRAGINRFPSNTKQSRCGESLPRYDKPRPGRELQGDVKSLDPVPGRPRRHFRYTAIDDCTRIRVHRICYRNMRQTAIVFVDYVQTKLPRGVQFIKTDSRSEFRSQSR